MIFPLTDAEFLSGEYTKRKIVMSLEETLNQFDLWLDKNCMIKSRAEDTDSGNGILYLSVAVAMIYEVYGDTSLKAHYHSAISSCFKKPGLLMRNPTGSFGLESWDDYLGVAVASIVLKNKRLPRQILWYGIKHFGYYNNTKDFTWAAFLWRFPHIWLLMGVAAFPALRYPLKPFLDFSALAIHADLNDASGVQLAWMFEYGIRASGFKVDEYQLVASNLPIAFERYYQREHFFHRLARAVALKASLRET